MVEGVDGGDDDDTLVALGDDGRGEETSWADEFAESPSKVDDSTAVGSESVFEVVEHVGDVGAVSGELITRNGVGDGRSSLIVETPLTVVTEFSSSETPAVGPVGEGFSKAVVGERPARVLTADGFETRDLSDDVSGALWALEQDSHIVGETESVDFGDALADNVGVDAAEERIPEAVRISPFVVAVAVARVRVKNAHAGLTLGNSLDGDP